MKKLLSLLLAAALLASAFALPFPARAADLWDAANHKFKLTSPPEIIFIEQESNERGTSVTAHYRASAQAKELAKQYYTADEDAERLLAEKLGLDVKDVWGYIRVGVQFAYSFDGTNWVNDWAPEGDPEDPYDQPETYFDFNEDGIEEYVDLPSENINSLDLCGDIELFNAGGSAFYAAYKDADTARETIDARIAAMLQGRGEYKGSYDPDGDDCWKGCMVDFNANTLYVKARYRVYTTLKTEESAGDLDIETVAYSDWSGVTTFNNSKASPEAQGCVPSKGALLNAAAPTLELLAVDRYDAERDGETIKAAFHRLVLHWPAETETALVRYTALSAEKRREYTDGEYYMPHVAYEMRVNDGPWIILDEFADTINTFFEIDDNYYTFYRKLEGAGYKPNDRVYVRAFLRGNQGFGDERIPNNSEYEIFGFTFDEDRILIRSDYSNAVELNLTGKYSVYYDTNGGSFPYDSTQREIFDDETNVTVDLTAPDYIPTRAHFIFRGWYDNPDFTGSPVTSFTTEVKMSRAFYAKWEELPYYEIAYDMGAVTAYVSNGNEERIYPDSGEEHNGVIPIEDVSYAGVTFLGWYDAPTGGNKVESLTYTAMTGNITLYARWQLPTYTITYVDAETNDPRNPATFQVDPAGENDVHIYRPAKKGYIFDGWYLKSDFTGGALSYNAEGDFWHLSESENVTLYAKWILGRWKINYDLGLVPEAWNGNPTEHTYGTADPLEPLSRDGWTWGGWFLDAGFTQPISVIPDDAEGEITVYAKWTVIPYDIVYDLRDPETAEFFTNPNPVTRTVEDEITLLPLEPKNEYFLFRGWYTNPNHNGDPVTKIDKGEIGKITLYAWVVRLHVGDVDADGEILPGDARLALRISLGLMKDGDVEMTPGMVNRADADGKEGVQPADARLILRKSLGLSVADEGWNDRY